MIRRGLMIGAALFALLIVQGGVTGSASAHSATTETEADVALLFDGFVADLVRWFGNADAVSIGTVLGQGLDQEEITLGEDEATDPSVRSGPADSSTRADAHEHSNASNNCPKDRSGDEATPSPETPPSEATPAPEPPPVESTPSPEPTPAV